MDWNINWVFTGSIAYGLVIINLIRTIIGKNKGWQILLFISLSCGAFTILSEYQMINSWIQHGDIAALEDVVPSLTPVLTAALCLGIFLNLIVLLINLKEEKDYN